MSPPGPHRPFKPFRIVTFSGRMIDLCNPRPEDVDFADIAHALSNLCRWGGHTSRYYSVAEHCVLVSYLVPKRLAIQGLLHDAHEAYVGDVITPIKVRLGEEYGKIAERWDAAISRRYKVGGLVDPEPEIKDADLMALSIEYKTLFPKRDPHFIDAIVPLELRQDADMLTRRWEREAVHGWEPAAAEHIFIDRCLELLKGA